MNIIKKYLAFIDRHPLLSVFLHALPISFFYHTQTGYLAIGGSIFLSAILHIPLAYIVRKFRTPTPITNNETEEVITEENFDEEDLIREFGRVEGYQARYLLTQNEWFEHQKLRKYAEAKGLVICPKVRLLDIVEPIRGEGYYSRLGRVQSKHVDFVICDQTMHIIGVVELDDNSHNRLDRQERDAFVDTVLRSVGYTVIHTRSITKTTLDPITKANYDTTTE